MKTASWSDKTYGLRAVFRQGIFQFFQAEISPAQQDQPSHHQPDLVSEEALSSNPEQKSFLRKKTCGYLPVFLDPAAAQRSFEKGLGRRFCAVVMKGMGPFKEGRAYFHCFDVELVLKTCHQRRSKGMIFLTKGKEIEVLFGHHVFYDIEFLGNLPDFQSADVRRKVLVEVLDKKIMIF